MKPIHFFAFIMFLSVSNLSFSAEKTLYLVRHAKSSHDDPNLKDFDRPLADRGHKDASKVAKRLKSAGIVIEYILASPSKRTKQTSKYFCAVLGYEYLNIEWETNIYRCKPTTMKTEISQSNNDLSSLMVFGHNPAITSCANFFQADTTFDNVPTTGVVAIQFDIDSWEEVLTKKGKLLFFEYPKRL